MTFFKQMLDAAQQMWEWEINRVPPSGYRVVCKFDGCIILEPIISYSAGPPSSPTVSIYRTIGGVAGTAIGSAYSWEMADKIAKALNKMEAE